jgi:16S rRNA (cytidine1402-2'-O)-methyltransferase
MPGTLFLIPNTLGETEALSHVIPEYVQATTAALGYFVAENAKTARAFLKLVGAQHPLSRPLQEIRISELNVNTPQQALLGLLEPLLAGQDADLVRLAHQHGIPVRPLVGPSSILLSVMASGLNGQSFAFNGYLPTDAAQRAKRIKELETRSRSEKQTQLFIETPYRNAAMLEALVASCAGGTLVCVATDISLPSETIRTMTGAQWKGLLAAGKAPDFHKKPTVFLILGQ